ncbi:GNAT family N-acetyltransferase [Paenarthrobacter sp. Z7-10]|uniref:GNAT family N-acetyltransferase n=1 Tax=Paenarthrobacter sp. Z7-10 TaxID=2787635 RepID=UPI0022A9D49B|nr:GNAT family N-acetyltransferase [Paenarthrobacter sp. Z7-10]MCZ2404733.1 GNAT family N-acetyltransferase [Paenarthrobacter sp. Z7-10]
MTDIILDRAGIPVVLRRATLVDLSAVIALLVEDPISAARADRGSTEDWATYERAFERIDADPAQQLLVAASPAGDVVATMQLTVIPGLARVGASRLQIEAVRVRKDLRGQGIGGAMIRWAVDSAPAQGARLVQLTSDAGRTDAHRFYTRLGFKASHVGFKYAVPSVPSLPSFAEPQQAQ